MNEWFERFDALPASRKVAIVAAVFVLGTIVGAVLF